LGLPSVLVNQIERLQLLQMKCGPEVSGFRRKI
jgi:hypothetical protein